MAPNLAAAQHDQIRDMIRSRELTDVQMASIAGCSTRSIQTIRLNLRCFGATKAPPNGVGRPSTVTPPMLSALCDRLIEKPDMYRDEMVVFLWDEFNTLVTASSISRALASAGWTKKVARRVALERSADLRDFYLYNLSAYRSYHLVYIDESGCDKQIGFRRTGWSPSGVTPVQVARFHRDRRYQILPAYTQDGIILARVFQGSTDAVVFADFIGQLLHHCGRWPEPKSVLVMDNASFHRSDAVERLCAEAGVKLLYLPPYSPDLNPIEEFFAELKAFIKRSWQSYADVPQQDFAAFLEWCVDIVGARKSSAEGHFRHAGLPIEEL
jgi:transposase